MDRVDHQLHVEHLFSLTASSIATGNVVVAVVVVAVHCSFSLFRSYNVSLEDVFWHVKWVNNNNNYSGSAETCLL